MKTSAFLASAVTALGFLVAVPAVAARGDMPCPGPGMMAGKMASQGPGKDWSQRWQQRLDKLHADLKLAPEQEGAWQSWRSSSEEKFKQLRAERPDFAALAKLPAPERMEKMLARHQAMQQEMEEALTALRAFYARLNPEQQKTFDAFAPFGHVGKAAPQKRQKEHQKQEHQKRGERPEKK